MCPRCKTRRKLPGQPYCRECRKAYDGSRAGKAASANRQAAFRKTEKGKAAAARYEKSEAGKAAHARSEKSTVGVLRKAAHQAVAKCKAEAHHPDYNKQLDVEWLCKSCHTEAH